MSLLFNLCDASSVATEYLHKTAKLFKKISLLTNNYSTNIAPLLTEIILTRQFTCYVSCAVPSSHIDLVIQQFIENQTDLDS